MSLPKGGGAIRGLGEKFSANPVTGTGGFTVPVALSPARFAPQLALSYDSGAGNGPFGLGWNLSVPSITRKTDRGLPRYADDPSDGFLFSGAEDLVPVLDDPHPLPEGPHRVERFRPRVEGLFARIERWTDPTTLQSSWRVVTRDDVTHWFGRDPSERVADPADPTRIFAWLLGESHDGKGNVVQYVWASEDSRGVDVAAPEERNRTEQGRSAARYLERVRYGNRISKLDPAFADDPGFMFELVVDYGDHVRHDPFSTFRAGFEVRTYRLCQRLLLFHHFPEDPDVGADCLVRSTDLRYGAEEPAVDEGRRGGPAGALLRSVTQTSYRGGRRRSLPPVELRYSEARVDETVRELAPTNLPEGVDGARYLWTDLLGEGISGVLTEQADGWFYKRNLGGGTLGASLAVAERPSSALASGARLVDVQGDGQLELVTLGGSTSGFYARAEGGDWSRFVAFRSIPNVRWDDPALRFVDLTGDGHADLLLTEDDAFTWYPSLDVEGYGPSTRLPLDLDEERGPRLVQADDTEAIVLADMSGDGLLDLVRIRNGQVCYWPNLGYGRFGAKVTMSGAPWFDRPDRFDPRRLRTGDVGGTGVTDLLYLGLDGVRLYLNQSGNGWSAARVLPPFPEVTGSVMVADLLGRGTACLVWSSGLPGHAEAPIRYVDLMGGTKPRLLVEVRNNLGATTTIEYESSTASYLRDEAAGTPWVTRLPFPVHVVARVTVADRWRGTRFSTSYSYHHGYFDGVEREFRGFGRVEQVDVETFGRFAAANVDSPYVSGRELYQPPVKAVTWYHTGAPNLVDRFAAEYFPVGRAVEPGYAERSLPEPDLAGLGLDADEWREAFRACKGRVLRTESYELDVDALEAGLQVPVRLFGATTHGYRLERLQPRGANAHAVFLATESEALTWQYELDLRGTEPLAPDPRISHQLVVTTDPLGQPVQQVTVTYARRRAFADPALSPETVALIRGVQGEVHLAYVETRYTDDVVDADHYRLRAPCDVRTFELTGVTWDGYLTLERLRDGYQLDETLRTAPTGVVVEELGYHRRPDGTPQKRLVEQVLTVFRGPDLAPLPLGRMGPQGIGYETYKLALTAELLDAVLGDQVDRLAQTGEARADAVARVLEEGGYRVRADFGADRWWIRSGTAEFPADAATRFFVPDRYVDPFGNQTRLHFHPTLLFPERVVDPVGNEIAVTRFDFRVLAPRELRDPNGNVTAMGYDTLGMPVASAVMGKDRVETGDSVDGLDPDVDVDEQIAFFRQPYDPARARSWLGTASARFGYSLGEERVAGELVYERHPASVVGLVRETHVALEPAGGTRIGVQVQYSDGAGQGLVAKGLAEPESPGGPLRWVATGRTVVNNKGKPVKQYEPYFSATEHTFGPVDEVGVTSILYYDAAGRQVRTELPDGSLGRVAFSPWQVETFDGNDTLGEVGSSWSTGRPEAAALEAVHAGTPSVTHLDSLGRDVVSIAFRRATGRPDQRHVTFTRLDAEGKPLWVTDARGNRVMQAVVPPVAPGAPDPTTGFAPAYDLAGNVLVDHSPDAGDRFTLADIGQRALYAWDDAGAAANLVHTAYDALRRPVHVTLRNPTHPDGIVVGWTGYGEALPDAAARNLRGQVHRRFDQSGGLTTGSMDYAGRPLEVRRRLASDLEVDIDWSEVDGLGPDEEPGALLPETFTQTTAYDAVGRTTRQVQWNRGAGARLAVVEPVYNERGLVQSEALTLDGVRTSVIASVTYDAKGQRQTLVYGNGVTTAYTYDPQTFRLIGLRTTRSADRRRLQDLAYRYDPEGNLLEVQDQAIPDVFFDNFRISARNRYTYDSLYRLVEAEGREHAGQVVRGQYDGWSDCPFRVRHAAGDAGAWREYVERYDYDPVGNVLSMQHVARGSGADSWTRHYEYATASNRLVATGMGPAPTTPYTDQPTLEYRYPHNAHGSMTAMQHLAAMDWDFTEHLRHVARAPGAVGADPDGCPDSSVEAWYRYDAGRQRSRKRVVKQQGVVEERLYLGGYEWYRRWRAGVLVEEIESVHVQDGDRRVLLVDDVRRTDRARLPTGPLYRYQLGNHLGSVALELDGGGSVVSYEEYHPYGTTAYQVTDSGREVPAKRYRYTGMERDEESGLSYHAARYFAPWVGRWSSADPSGLTDGPNRFSYCGDSPTEYRDPSGYERVGQPRDSSGALLSDDQIRAQWSPEVEKSTIERYLLSYEAILREIDANELGREARGERSVWNGELGRYDRMFHPSGGGVGSLMVDDLRRQIAVRNIGRDDPVTRMREIHFQYWRFTSGRLEREQMLAMALVGMASVHVGAAPARLGAGRDLHVGATARAGNIRNVANAGPDKCVGAVCTIMINQAMGAGPGESGGYTVREVERAFSVNFGRLPTGLPNPAVATPNRALHTIVKIYNKAATLLDFPAITVTDRVGANFGQAVRPGEYAIFFEESHVVYGRIAPNGRTSILDANVGRGWGSWGDFQVYAAKHPELYGSRPNVNTQAFHFGPVQNP